MFRRRDERKLSAVPLWLRVSFALFLAAQLGVRALADRPSAKAVDLSMPPSTNGLRILSFGEPITFSQLLALNLQAFDNQPGISIPFAQLDYGRVKAWLSRMLDLDPIGQYPLMMAAQLYAQVNSRPDKQREMSEFVYEQFLLDPDRRWQWLAHVAIMAKHRLKDLPLALKYADAINMLAHGANVPSWAKQMNIFIREDMGEYETAKILLGGLLASGTITDPHEIHFLTERLNALENAEKSTGPSK